MWQEADLSKFLSTDSSLPLFVGHERQECVMPDSEVYEERA